MFIQNKFREYVPQFSLESLCFCPLYKKVKSKKKGNLSL
jgi:hypothetical protein